MIKNTKTKKPNINEDTFIAETADIIGDVSVGEGSSIWYGAIARGDLNYITIGKNTNIQDNSTLHVDSYDSLEIGDYVTIGHNVVAHGCKIGNNCIIGMGSIILNKAVIGDNCIIGAGSLITAGTIISPNSLVMGAPGKVKREISEDEIPSIRENALRYVKLWRDEYL